MALQIVYRVNQVSKWNSNRDKEFSDNLRLDYGTMQTSDLQFTREMLYDDLYTWGSKMNAIVRATKELRLAVLEEVLAERGVTRASSL